MSKRKRLDALIVELGILPNRQIAHSAIMNGAISVNGLVITKPGTMVLDDATIELNTKWQSNKYVSRGGIKLEAALNTFNIDMQNRICLDVGASTGGFTDCLLQHGASKVYAIDVGYGQLDWSLRNNPKVIVKERINARNLSVELLYAPDDAKANFCVMDVSFISLVKVLPAVLSVLDAKQKELVCLIKPQFEIGKALIGKGGVVRNKDHHIEVIEQVLDSASKNEVVAYDLTYSPITGPKGNIEFFVHWLDVHCAKSSILKQIDSHSIKKIVNVAHQKLKSIEE
jgi:23S rRNA (cytidine1920-2'-O)/16S rRNA (cytidine1409-2'-O)-methyltransferase